MGKRIFISFAIEDRNCRDMFTGQAINTRTPFEFIDMSVKEPWVSDWKSRCRSRIKGCDGVIALISRRTRFADGAKWEMQCANEEGIPMIGVHAYSDDKGEIPPQLQGYRVINWTWSGIANFIDSL